MNKYLSTKDYWLISPHFVCSWPDLEAWYQVFLVGCLRCDCLSLTLVLVGRVFFVCFASNTIRKLYEPGIVRNTSTRHAYGGTTFNIKVILIQQLNFYHLTIYDLRHLYDCSKYLFIETYLSVKPIEI